MANRFLNNIKINDSYTLPTADGTADQIITTDGAGQLSFIDQSTLNSGSAERTEILVKNLEGSALSKGDPVYIIGSVGASERLKVGLADAGNAAKMPCVGLLTQDLANNGEGTAIVTGKLKNLITSPIDGATPTENDTIYVKSGGGLTLTKPTGSTNLIQNVGQIGRVSTSSDGNIVVSAILRSNDVPNLPTGKIWVGDGNTTVSDVVYLDEANGRMGIGTTDPDTKLDVVGRAVIGTGNTLTNETNATVIGNSNNLTSDSIVDSNTNLVLGDYGAGRYGNTVISDRTLRLGRADVISASSSNTTGVLNFNDSVEANSAFANVGGFVGYFPPPTTTANYNFFNAFSENVNGSVFATGASPTASRMQISMDPNLDCVGYKFDSNTSSGGGVYYTASQNNANPSSRGIFTFDARHQNQNYAAPDGHALFEVTSGYGQTKFIIKQVSGSSNVGIGTTNPGQKLDVSGNIKMTETAAIADTDKFVVLDSGVLKYRTGSQVITDLPTDNRYVAVTGDTMTGFLYMNKTGTGQLNINNGQAVFGTHWNSQDVYMFSASGRDILLGGGIGGIQNDVRVGNGDLAVSGGNIEIADANYVGGRKIGFNVSDSISFNSTTIAQYGMSNAGNSEAGGITYSGFFGQKFFTNGTQRMVIKRYGNVGIGTTDPQSKLHVSSDSDPTIIVGTTIANQANSGKISFRELPNISEFELRYNGSSNRFDIWNSVGGEAISILRSNSNVGIGDTDPDAKLTVFRTSTSFATALSTAESRAGLSVKSTSTYDAKLTVSTGTSGIQQIQGVNNAATTGRDIAINPYGGNVGIGTTIPGQKLSIAPDTDVSAEIGKAHIGLVGYANYAGFSHVDQNTNAQAYALLQSEDGQTFINANTGKNIWFRIANSDKMILNSSGNVGIGTTNPQSLLQVGHTGATSNVAVRAQSGDSYQVGFEAYGSSQGTGYMYVGQSNTYGGGVAYNGDGSPASFDSGTIGSDKITFFRRADGVDTAVIWYQYNSNDVNFRGDVIAYATSDEKLKDNINLIPNSIEKIKALRGVTFEWNEKSNKEVGKKEIGVIAQDVEKVLPEIVKTRDNGYKAVDYQKLTAVLIEAIKEQQKQIDELKAIINGGSK